MTKKHYIQIAKLINEYELASEFVLDLALLFKSDNPRFDGGKFLEAAGYPELRNTKQGLN